MNSNKRKFPPVIEDSQDVHSPFPVLTPLDPRFDGDEPAQSMNPQSTVQPLSIYSPAFSSDLMMTPNPAETPSDAPMFSSPLTLSNSSLELSSLPSCSDSKESDMQNFDQITRVLNGKEVVFELYFKPGQHERTLSYENNETVEQSAFIYVKDKKELRSRKFAIDPFDQNSIPIPVACSKTKRRRVADPLRAVMIAREEKEMLLSKEVSRNPKDFFPPSSKSKKTNKSKKIKFDISSIPPTFMIKKNGEEILLRHRGKVGVHCFYDRPDVRVSSKEDKYVDDCKKSSIYTNSTSRCEHWRMQDLKIISNSFA